MVASVQEVKAGAGIRVEAVKRNLSPEMMAFRKASEAHYVFFPLGAPPYGDLHVIDRQLSISKVYRGRIMLLQNIDLVDRNLTEAALMKENVDDTPEFIRYPKLAKYQADELHESYPGRGLALLNCITGEDPDVVAYLEEVILPTLPTNIVGIAKALGAAEARVAAIEDKDYRKLGMALLTEMLAAVEEGFYYADEYIGNTETEQVSRSQANGTGKAKLDRADKYYYTQLDRKPAHGDNIVVSVGTIAGSAAAAAIAQETKECPECGEAIALKAKKCRFCDYRLEPFKEIKEEKKK